MLRLLTLALGVVLLSSEAVFAGTPPVAVPEPASMALLATSVGALLIYRLRGRK